ncbi:MAG: energy-coupling factor transporter transmembrane protein EcfT [Clostridia bacterium]|nr:energy-coupling factor transporter transmembrane protein EcfT [Clostridia bacterium]
MIRDITIGQFFPGDSFIHKLDARAKIVITVLYIIALFMCKNFFSLSLMLLFSVVCVFISRISPKLIWKSLKTIIFIVLFTSALQIIYNNRGEVLWKPFESREFAVTTGGIYSAVFLAVRIIALILLSSLLTYTTSPTMLTDALERLLSPLKVFGVKVHSLAMMMTIALRFIPTLINEIDIIMSAQKARGAKLDNGSVGERMKAMISVFIPLFVSAFRRAAELAVAMECRCYTDGASRTRLKVMKMGYRDAVAFGLLSLVIAGALFTSYYGFSSMFIFEPVM